MAFSASDAAFEGFRIVRRTPLAVVGWALVYIAAFAVGFALIGPRMIELIQQAEALEGRTDFSPEELMPLLQGYAVVLSVIGPLSILVSAVLTTAIARAVLEPEAKRFFYLRLGKDELRLLGASVVLFVLIGAYYVLTFGLCFALGRVALTSSQPWLFIPCFLGALAAFLGLFWLAVRFSLVAPVIVAEKRFTIFESFRLTKGRFWPLFGMAVLAGVMSIVVSILGSLIGLPFQVALTDPFSQIEGGASIVTVLGQAAPLVIGWAVVNAVISALQLALLYAPFSAAYRDIKAAS